MHYQQGYTTQDQTRYLKGECTTRYTVKTGGADIVLHAFDEQHARTLMERMGLVGTPIRHVQRTFSSAVEQSKNLKKDK